MSGQEKKHDGPDFSREIPLGDLTESSMILGQVTGETVVQARSGGALRDRRGVHPLPRPLAERMLVADTVRCPRHHAGFSLRTEEALRPPALNPVSCWRIEQRGRKNLCPRKARTGDAPGAATDRGSAPSFAPLPKVGAT